MEKKFFREIENKWQKKWEKAKIFKSPDKSKKKKFYILEMYPYPSGYGAHIGHTKNYILGDVLSRFKRMQGFNVMHPMGWDSFGLPTENYAIEKGIHPTISIKENIKIMKDQFTSTGLDYDWSREIATHEPEYYKWTQWLFLKLFENGLAYKKLSPGNWCPSCKTTLANEDVKAGKCWRCETEVVQKNISQWFFKITNYADELLEGLNKIKWSQRLKALQKNWIGKSHGIEIFFKLKDSNKTISTFTTRPDTAYGITFVVFAPEHPKVLELVKGTKYEQKVKDFLKETRKMNEVERLSKEKDGLFIGKYAINPVNGKDIPIYIANFVLPEYGTGMVMAVPTHDQRDFEFAKKYKIPMVLVIKPKDKKLNVKTIDRAYVDEGFLVNSEQFNGLNNKDAIEKISDYLEKKGWGKRTINYKIRDWCVSRQRYWGAPIPVVYCEKCGIVPIPEKDLPVKLPLNVDFSSKNATTPLATNEKFVNAKCPKCKGSAKRETDTMTTFVDSAWYFLRFCDPNNKKAIFDKSKVKHWLPVDQYIGGVEHAVGHCMYARFITRFLKKLGYVTLDEPFMKLLNQGMINLGGVKMSKSKGNIIDPRDVIKKFSADILRTYLMIAARPDKDVEWSDKDMNGMVKFIEKVYSLANLKENKTKKDYIESVAQSKIKIITENIESLDINIAMIELVDFANKLEKYYSKYAFTEFLKLLTPFAPHACEELWSKLGNKGFISTVSWPKVDKKKINESAEKAEEAVGKIVSDIHHIIKIVNKKPKKIYIYVIPSELKTYKEMEDKLAKEFSAEVKVYASNDKNKYDPQNKAKKAKPQKPGIYLE